MIWLETIIDIFRSKAYYEKIRYVSKKAHLFDLWKMTQIHRFKLSEAPLVIRQ